VLYLLDTTLPVLASQVLLSLLADLTLLAISTECGRQQRLGPTAEVRRQETS
jgi:hypothetical protein